MTPATSHSVALLLLFGFWPHRGTYRRSLTLRDSRQFPQLFSSLQYIPGLLWITGVVSLLETRCWVPTPPGWLRGRVGEHIEILLASGVFTAELEFLTKAVLNFTGSQRYSIHNFCYFRSMYLNSVVVGNCFSFISSLACFLALGRIQVCSLEACSCDLQEVFLCPSSAPGSSPCFADCGLYYERRLLAPAIHNSRVNNNLNRGVTQHLLQGYPRQLLQPLVSSRGFPCATAASSCLKGASGTPVAPPIASRRMSVLGFHTKVVMKIS